MANFLTQGRLALLGALKDDPQIAAAVKTWLEFGSGLSRRYELEAAFCPLLALCPARAEVECVANVEREVPQLLRIDIATDGQDAAPAEELTALVVQRVHLCNENCLGLASGGLAGVHVQGLRWEAVPDRAGARMLWTVAITVRLLWRKRSV